LEVVYWPCVRIAAVSTMGLTSYHGARSVAATERRELRRRYFAARVAKRTSTGSSATPSSLWKPRFSPLLSEKR
jgi:hypothetical protein